MESQLEKLRDEVIRVKQQRKRELIQLRSLRDQEAAGMKSDFESQVCCRRQFLTFCLCLTLGQVLVM